MADVTFSLPAYLERVTASRSGYLTMVGVQAHTDVPPATLNTLTMLMEAQSIAISFENIDVVLGGTISMAPDDVFKKLVLQKRGGYCFEQNTLLQSALVACGFEVQPMLTRVRWGKKPEEDTAYTHIVLAVSGTDFQNYLADVGFACTNSYKPIALGKDGEVQTKEHNTKYRTATEGGYTSLEVQDRNDAAAWRALYKWRVDRWETTPDFLQSNWFSCTFPTARFTTQFFVARMFGTDKLHVLNNQFVKRSMLTGEVVESGTVDNLESLVEMLGDKFGLEVESCENLGRYL